MGRDKGNVQVNGTTLRRLATLAILALVLTGCGSDTCTGPTAGYSRSSPNELLLAFALALEQGDINIYEECLSPDYFFMFHPDDSHAAGVSPKSPMWNRDRDIAAMDSLFRDPTASIEEAGFDVVARQEWSARPESLMQCVPYLEVCFRGRGGNDDTTYITQGSWLDTYFVRDKRDTDLWQIAAMYDCHMAKEPLMGGAVATAYSTFGRIKAMHRPLEPCEVTPRSSIQCLLRNFELALERMDIDAYDACLSEEYRFGFDPVDWDEAGVVPDNPWWEKTEDMESMSAIFASHDVPLILCDLEIVYGPWPTEHGWGLRLEPYMVFTVNPGQEGAVDYVVGGSWLDVEIVDDPYDPVRWLFKEIAESIKEPMARGAPPGHAPLTEGSTHGSIKAMYR